MGTLFPVITFMVFLVLLSSLRDLNPEPNGYKPFALTDCAKGGEIGQGNGRKRVFFNAASLGVPQYAALWTKYLFPTALALSVSNLYIAYRFNGVTTFLNGLEDFEDLVAPACNQIHILFGH